MTHVPVLVKEVLHYLDPQPDENFIDGTFGQGGHTKAILEKNAPEGKVLGIEWDEKESNDITSKRLIVVNDSYTHIKEIVQEKNFGSVNGIVLDLGMSSWHLEESGRGFAFSKDEPLDMRYSSKNELTAAQIINQWSEGELEKIIKEYGEERFAKQIAKGIVEQRKIKKIESTFELIDIISQAIPTFAKSKSRGLSAWERAQAGARTFQALRIATNRELENVENVLPVALEVLESGGRLVVISFHSLEDRIVKNFFREKAKEGIVELLTKKPIQATADQMQENTRSRSAKLRAIKKI